MLRKNVGGIDRAVRVLVGLGLLTAFFLNPDAPYRWAYLLGLVPLYTGIVGYCPPYAWFGISTRRKSHH